MNLAVLAVVVALTIFGAPSPVHAADDAPKALPAGIAEPADATVSGVSSGGYMAVQMHVAHSASVTGAGVVAAGPYHCAGGSYPFNLLRATNTCANMADLVPFMGPPALAPSIEQTQTEAMRGRIDDPAHMRRARVYLFSGRLDETVPQSVTDVLKAYYETFVPSDNIAYVNNIRAAHAMISADFGNACDTSKDPYINDCDYDAAGALLTHLYGPLARPADDAPGTGGKLIRFDQIAFDPDAAAHGLAAEGYVFVPDGCTGDKACRLHVAFHGCRQYTGAVGDAFVAKAGYNGWAAANDIIVLYPQAAPLRRRLLGIALPWPNPNGCWDWWGFTGRDYDVKSGAQIAAVWAMIERLTGSR